MLKRILLAVAILAFWSAPFAVFAQGKSEEAKGKPPAVSALPGTCTITGNGLITDMRDQNCFPQFDADKCSYYMQVPSATTKGASPADVDDAKKHGLQVMKYAATQACEGRSNCGFYVAQFASTAACDGKVVQDMPGGEYRGLTASAARNIQMRVNREAEQASASGKERGDKTKNPKHKGKIWGAED